MIRALPLLLLTGCAAQAPAPAKPDLSALLEPCKIEQPRKYSGEEAVRVANARRDALIKCNADKAKLREALQ